MGRGTAERPVVLPTAPAASDQTRRMLVDGVRDLAREYAARAARQGAPKPLQNVLRAFVPGTDAVTRERTAGYAEMSRMFARLALALECPGDAVALEACRHRINKLLQDADALRSRGRSLAYREAALGLLHLYREGLTAHYGWA